jgi:hypothetical protein
MLRPDLSAREKSCRDGQGINTGLAKFQPVGAGLLHPWVRETGRAHFQTHLKPLTSRDGLSYIQVSADMGSGGG